MNSNNATQVPPRAIHLLLSARTLGQQKQKSEAVGTMPALVTHVQCRCAARRRQSAHSRASER